MRGHGLLMAAAGGGLSYKDLILADGPAAFWMMDEATGTTCADSVAGLTATLSGTYARAQPGPAGLGGLATALNSSAAAATAATTTLDAATLTAECWFNKTGTATGELLSYGSYNYLRFQTTTTINTIFSGANKLSSAAFSDKAWHHVVMVVSPTGLKTYLDGSLSASNANAYPAQSASNVINIGVGSSTEYFTGFIAGVALYKKELTAAQVLAHYNAGK